MKIQYLAWLSSKGERNELKEGALFAGLVCDVPEKYRHLLDEKEERKYVVITGD